MGFKVIVINKKILKGYLLLSKKKNYAIAYATDITFVSIPIAVHNTEMLNNLSMTLIF
jgi:hypothetical protein